MRKLYGLLTLILLLILIAVITVLLIVNSREGSDDFNYNVYFLSSGAGAYEFKAEKHRINYTAAEDIAKSLINILISGPDSKELISPFPENVRLLSLSKTNTAMYIKYSDEYLNMTEFEMNLADYCVVKTLSGINGIQKFQFSLDGEPHPVSGYRFVTLEDFITNKNAFQILTRNITLYYPSEDYSGLVARNVSFRCTGTKRSKIK